jgi:hypothetical protein
MHYALCIKSVMRPLRGVRGVHKSSRGRAVLPRGPRLGCAAAQPQQLWANPCPSSSDRGQTGNFPFHPKHSRLQKIARTLKRNTGINRKEHKDRKELFRPDRQARTASLSSLRSLWLDSAGERGPTPNRANTPANKMGGAGILNHGWTRSVNPIQNTHKTEKSNKTLVNPMEFALTRQNFPLLSGACADTFTDIG